jgi:hypothetical protein
MPSLTRRRTARNLAKEMMPGPRLPVVRPAVSRFTLRKELTVAPRNKRLHTVRVRKTAANLAKRIQNIPGHIKNLQEAQDRQQKLLNEASTRLRSLNSNPMYNALPAKFRTQRKRQEIKIKRSYEDMLRKIKTVLNTLDREKQRYNNPKRPTLTVRSIEAPNEFTKAVPNLPGIVEEENRNI